MQWNEYERAVAQAWDGGQTPQLDLRGLFICTAGLSGELGEALEVSCELLELQRAISHIQEPIKKLVRSGIEVKRAELTNEMGDVLYYLTRLGQHFGITLEDAARANMRKLEERYGGPTAG